MVEHNTFQNRTRDFNEYGEAHTLTVSFGMSYHLGNSAPHFSITSETRKKGRKRIESCGCQHDTTEQVFPELAPLIRWHLTDQNGVPMHYIANGLYWFDCAAGKYDRRSYDPDPLETFRSHVVLGRLDGDEKVSVEKLFKCSRDFVKTWMQKRADALRTAFLADLEKFNVELIDVSALEG